jgi:hypothetical protein
VFRRGLRIAAGIDRRDWRAQRQHREVPPRIPRGVVAFGRPDEHGGCARAAWRPQWGKGQPDLCGEDFAELAADMRIRLLVFFDGASSANP